MIFQCVVNALMVAAAQNTRRLPDQKRITNHVFTITLHKPYFSPSPSIVVLQNTDYLLFCCDSTIVALLVYSPLSFGVAGASQCSYISSTAFFRASLSSQFTGGHIDSLGLY